MSLTDIEFIDMNSYTINRFTTDSDIVNSYVDKDLEELKRKFPRWFSRVASSEEFAQKYFEMNGFHVLRLSTRHIWNPKSAISCDYSSMYSEFWDWFKSSYGTKPQNLLSEGVPDFLIFKESNRDFYEVQFVEVKTNKGGLSLSQLKWFILNINLPLKIFSLQNWRESK